MEREKRLCVTQQTEEEVIVVTSPTGTIGKQVLENVLDNAEPRTPENTTPTSFRWRCEQVLKPAVLS
jgi:uncharacterized protein (UPF0218 family)